MVKKRLGDIEIDLTEVNRLAEFIAVLVLGYIVGSGIRDSLLLTGYPASTAVPVQWLAFFALILIYYGLIRVRLNINK